MEQNQLSIDDVISAIGELYLENYKLRKRILIISQELEEIKKELSKFEQKPKTQ